jgi:hypothetical protein
LKASVTTYNWNSGSRSSAGSGTVKIPGVLENGNLHDNAIVCNCNVDAVLLTVRKEGPNKGWFNSSSQHLDSYWLYTVVVCSKIFYSIFSFLCISETTEQNCMKFSHVEKRFIAAVLPYLLVYHMHPNHTQGVHLARGFSDR